MIARSDYRKVLWFAVLYAAVLVGIHIALEVSSPPVVVSFLRDLLYLIEPVAIYVNTAGEILSGLIAALYLPKVDYSVAWWAWMITFRSIGSLAQGFAYGWLGMLSWRLWSTSRVRAIAYPLATAWIMRKSFVAGRSHFHEWCFGTDAGSCDMGWERGMEWAAIAFGGCFVLIVLLEVLIGSRDKQPTRS
jgi:hypothetical protein